MSGPDEFEFIRSRLAPLSQGEPGAALLCDDAATISVSAGHDLVVTTDVLVEGRHFPFGEDPALAARKALRVNLSDLAAMGARPRAYLTSVVWPEDGFEARADGFVKGLEVDQACYGVTLIGGDTTSGPGPWTLAVTALGEAPTGAALRRTGARPGDALLVSGTIGDAGLGLQLTTGALTLADPAHVTHVLNRLRLPEPRIAAGQALRGLASAAIDVSDGLLADARHLAEASACGLEIELGDLPLSEAACGWLDKLEDAEAGRLALAAAGDDYELAFAAPAHQVQACIEACAASGVSARPIGRFTAASGIDVRIDGAPVVPERWGFTHF